MSYRMKKASELRQMSTEELRERLRDIGASLIMLRGQLHIGYAVPTIKNIRKEKVRILTILGEKKRSKIH